MDSLFSLFDEAEAQAKREEAESRAAMLASIERTQAAAAMPAPARKPKKTAKAKKK